MWITSHSWTYIGGRGLNSFSVPYLVERLREHNVVQIASRSIHCAVLVIDPNPSTIRQAQRESFNNQLHSDVVFMVENEPIYANVDILSEKSDYFAAMFRCNMRESLERVVQVPNCSKAAFQRVLVYLYMDASYIMGIEDVVEVWGLADMYQLEGLKWTCMGSLERGLCDESILRILQEIEDMDCACDGLKGICDEYKGSKVLR